MKSTIFTLSMLMFMISIPLTIFGAETSDPDELLKEAEELFEAGDEKEALEVYLEVLDEEPENYEALWNASFINSRLGYQLGDDEEEKQLEYYEEALDLADRAIEHHDDEGHSYYVKAVALGRWSELQDKETRIETSHEIRENIEKAADMIPDYAPVWHLYGVFHSDVANISGAEQFAANLISEGVPDGSNDKAEEYLKKAIDMMPESILFRLDLAKHYMKVDEDDKAKEVLEEISEMEVELPNEGQLKEEAEQILEEL
jgi:tetratricopeptide (TPR) repeat protein